MHRRKSFPVLLAMGLIAAGLTASQTYAVDESDREGRWQFSIPINYLSGDTWDGAGGSSIDLHSDLGFGFGFGYNLNERLYLGSEFTWIYVDYDVNLKSAETPPLADIQVGGELDASTFAFKGQFNFMEKTITPFLGAGFGWTYIDSNIATGEMEGFCWYDPWWGTVCTSYYDTYDDTTFSYSLNGGLRAEVSDTFFLQAAYQILWVDTDQDDIDVDGFRLELGWLF